MPTAKVQQDVISAAVCACEKGGQGLAALALFEAMPRPKFSRMSSPCHHLQYRPSLRVREMDNGKKH